MLACILEEAQWGSQASSEKTLRNQEVCGVAIFTILSPHISLCFCCHILLPNERRLAPLSWLAPAQIPAFCKAVEVAQPICLIGLAQWACYPIRSARKELKARVRKRFLSKDQLRVGWDFSPATLTFKQVTRAPPSPTWGGDCERQGRGAKLEQAAPEYISFQGDL